MFFLRIELIQNVRECVNSSLAVNFTEVTTHKKIPVGEASLSSETAPNPSSGPSSAPVSDAASADFPVKVLSINRLVLVFLNNYMLYR